MNDGRHVEPEILPICARHGIGVTVFSPLAQGLLTGKYNEGAPPESRGARSDWLKRDLTEENVARVRRLTVLAKDLGLHREVNQAIQETDVIQFRNQWDTIHDSIEPEYQQSIARKVIHNKYARIAAASVIVLVAIGLFLNNILIRGKSWPE